MNRIILKKINRKNKLIFINDNYVNQEIINTYFNSNLGFGKYKNTAIELLNLTINILNEFNIPYCIICGTLLGYVRHNDFIPWDDDIDLLIHNSILGKLDLIINKYTHILTFIRNGNHLKCCFKDKEKILNCSWNDYLINKTDNYNWPFIDLFIFIENDSNINFFGKSWNKKYFFPVKIVTFLELQVAIPNNPSYFLELNYSKEYNDYLVSSNWNHSNEESNKTLIKITFNSYKKYIV
jgi:hypothetical protein